MRIWTRNADLKSYFFIFILFTYVFQLGNLDSRQDLAIAATAALPASSPFAPPPLLRPAAVGESSGGGERSEPRPFLKRGSGLSRFNLPPDPALQPSRLHRRSRSSPKLGGDNGADRRNPARLRFVLPLFDNVAEPATILSGYAYSLFKQKTRPALFCPIGIEEKI
jgi:hypothetical protein